MDKEEHTAAQQPVRCRWLNLADDTYVAYHDKEWGRPVHDDRKLYEMLILECFQAGLSWECILKKRENFRRDYDGFDAAKVAAYGPEKIESLMNDPSIVRNRHKIEASINNSRVFLEIVKEFGSFDRYLWDFCGNQVICESWELRTTSPLSDALARDLKKRGMKFVGSTTIYAYLQSVGVINAHSDECYLAPGKNQGGLR